MGLIAACLGHWLQFLGPSCLCQRKGKLRKKEPKPSLPLHEHPAVADASPAPVNVVLKVDGGVQTDDGRVQTQDAGVQTEVAGVQIDISKGLMNFRFASHNDPCHYCYKFNESVTHENYALRGSVDYYMLL